MTGKLVLITAIVVLFSACSNAISLGKNQTYCEEHGFNFSDAGLCGDPMLIYKNRNKIIRKINNGSVR